MLLGGIRLMKDIRAILLFKMKLWGVGVGRLWYSRMTYKILLNEFLEIT
jgi:hypothetical protein